MLKEIEEFMEEENALAYMTIPQSLFVKRYIKWLIAEAKKKKCNCK